MPNIIFADVETNGKPIDSKAPMSSIENWPRITQLAFQITDPSGKLINESSDLIKPEGWTIPNEDFFIKHGFSTENNMKHGRPILRVLDHFCFSILLEDVDTLVCHNINFDYNVIGAELKRCGLSTGRRLKKVCTQESSTNVLKLPGMYGKYKWPKLEELYRFLFNKDFEGAHNAMADVAACKECYFELKRLGYIN